MNFLKIKITQQNTSNIYNKYNESVIQYEMNLRKSQSVLSRILDYRLSHYIRDSDTQEDSSLLVWKDTQKMNTTADCGQDTGTDQ